MENLFKIKSQTNLLLVTFFILCFRMTTFWLSSAFVVTPDLILQSSQEEVAVGELIPPSLKRVKDYPSELDTKTLKEIIKLSKGKGRLLKKLKN